MSNINKLIARATDSFPEIIAYYLATLTVSGVLFAYFEGKPLFESFWWACVTGLTIGYGDMYPVTVGGKIVAIVLMHVVPLIIIPLIVARLLSTVIEDKNVFSDAEQEALKSDIAAIKKALKIEKAKEE
ncbi:MAG: Ion transport protein [Acidobacteria bacterium OLB17]|nr:MAG: Ion transport protein [Acidobacteria bacterium OLB17]MCZ2389500.1 potassium channel family protein [Acidobacteriota bacterium]